MLLLQEAFLECTSPFPVTLSPSLVPPWSGEGHILPSSPLWGGGGDVFSLKLLTAAALTGNYLQPQGRNSPKV